MKWSPVRALLLIAGLLFVQAAAVAHAFEHPALTQASHHCTFCAHGFGLDHTPVAHTQILIIPVANTTPPIAAVATPVMRRRSAYRSRAPPAYI